MPVSPPKLSGLLGHCGRWVRMTAAGMLLGDGDIVLRLEILDDVCASCRAGDADDSIGEQLTRVEARQLGWHAVLEEDDAAHIAQRDRGVVTAPGGVLPRAQLGLVDIVGLVRPRSTTPPEP